jgi:tetratricopeptide (TPR) repeat protein
VVGLTWSGATSVRAEDASGATSDVARAEAYAADAFEAYARKDYSAAIALYQKALEATPSADILYNLARIYDTKLKDRGLAIEYYRRYAADTGADPNRVRIVNGRLADLRQLEAVAAEAPPPPEEPATSVAFKAEPSTSQPKAANDEKRGLNTLQIASIVTGAVGVAGIGVGVGFGFAAKSDADVADRVCNGNACSTQRGVEASKDASNAATISTIAFIAGGALAVVGITGVLLGSGGSSERQTAALSVAPFGSASNVGAQLAGRW